MFFNQIHDYKVSRSETRSVRVAIGLLTRCTHEKNTFNKNCIKELIGPYNKDRYVVVTANKEFFNEISVSNSLKVIVVLFTDGQLYIRRPSRYARSIDHFILHDDNIRLQLRANLLRRTEKKDAEKQDAGIGGDSMFKALSIALDLKKEVDVRASIVDQLRCNPKIYLHFFNEDKIAFKTYLRSLLLDGTWGDSITLQAAADFFKVKVVVVSGSVDQKLMEWDPSNMKNDSVKVIFLSYLDGFRYGALHYNQEWTQLIKLEEDNRVGFCYQRDENVRKLHNERFENLEGDHAFLLGAYNNANVLEMTNLVESRLQTYLLKQVVVGGDGNCLYRSLSHIENDKKEDGEDGYEAVKTKILKQLTEHPEFYRKFVYGDYIKCISRPFAFADNPVLRAYCDVSDYRVASIGPTPFEVLYDFSPGDCSLRSCTKDIFLADIGYHNNPVYFQCDTEVWLQTSSAPAPSPELGDMFAPTP